MTRCTFPDAFSSTKMSFRPMNAMPIGCTSPDDDGGDGKVRVDHCRPGDLALQGSSREDGKPYPASDEGASQVSACPQRRHGLVRTVSYSIEIA